MDSGVKKDSATELIIKIQYIVDSGVKKDSATELLGVGLINKLLHINDKIINTHHQCHLSVMYM